MSYDEKTQEIEIKAIQGKDNIVPFNTHGRSPAPPPSTPTQSQTIPTQMPQPPQKAQSTSLPWWSQFDLRTPWVIRLLAVIFLLILSMLIL